MIGSTPRRTPSVAGSAHFPVAHARGLAAIVPGARLVVLEGAPHWMIIERPEEVAAAMGAFLATVAG